jgi:cytochrome c
MRVDAAILFCAAAAFMLSSCAGNASEHVSGIAGIGRYGCGSCHTIPGVSGANGRVGPSLAGIGNQRYIAGHLSNTSDNLTRWIQHPHAVNEKTIMPELGVTARDATDIAALLNSLK